MFRKLNLVSVILVLKCAILISAYGHISNYGTSGNYKAPVVDYHQQDHHENSEVKQEIYVQETHHEDEPEHYEGGSHGGYGFSFTHGHEGNSHGSDNSGHQEYSYGNEESEEQGYSHGNQNSGHQDYSHGGEGLGHSQNAHENVRHTNTPVHTASGSYGNNEAHGNNGAHSNIPAHTGSHSNTAAHAGAHSNIAAHAGDHSNTAAHTNSAAHSYTRAEVNNVAIGHGHDGEGHEGYEEGAGHEEKHHDYHHYPAYKYEYGVDDPKTKDRKTHWETRDGDVVKGEYTLNEPDGTVSNFRLTKILSYLKTYFTLGDIHK